MHEGDNQSLVYLDNNATTPLEPKVLDSIQDALKNAWGNPSSSHEAGKKAKAVIDKSRQAVARMVGAQASDIIFTSGGTEANNMILETAVRYFNERYGSQEADDGSGRKQIDRPHIISSHMEHPAVSAYLLHLKATQAAEVTYVPLSKVTGRLEVKDVLAAVRPNTILITVMLANNETGIIQPVSEISEAVRRLKRGKGETNRILVHTDAAQAIGKIPVDVTDLDVDYLTVVGHKYYGPRIGAVYTRGLEQGLIPLFPMLHGGGQERGYRPGTENTGMIAGLGKASELVTDHLSFYEKQFRNCRDYLESQLETVLPCKVQFNGKLPGNERLPNTCNVSLIGEGLEGHHVLSKCPRLQASVGAACHTQNRPSPILQCIGIPEDVARKALRLSVGRYTTLADIDIVVKELHQAVVTILEERSVHTDNGQGQPS